jgi:hypothetical protein
VVHLLHRQQCPGVGLVPGLRPRPAARGGPRRRALDGQWIGRGRSGGVLRALPQLLLDGSDLRLQRRDPLLLLGDDLQELLDDAERLLQRARARRLHTPTSTLPRPEIPNILCNGLNGYGETRNGYYIYHIKRWCP